MDIEKHFDMLGLKGECKVTGFSGVITSLSFDLYGCIQVVITPDKTSKEGAIQEGHWFDVNRVQITSDTPVMELPDFDKGYVATGNKGCASKPLT